MGPDAGVFVNVVGLVVLESTCAVPFFPLQSSMSRDGGTSLYGSFRWSKRHQVRAACSGMNVVFDYEIHSECQVSFNKRGGILHCHQKVRNTLAER